MWMPAGGSALNPTLSMFNIAMELPNWIGDHLAEYGGRVRSTGC